MADKNTKIYVIRMKFGTRRLLQSLNTNSTSTFKNKNWRIQYCGPKCKKLRNFEENI